MLKMKRIKDEFAPQKPIKGYPNCMDRTLGYPECLPPGQIIKQAIRPDVLWDIPVGQLLTKEQLNELADKMQNYPTNDFIYLTHVHSLKDSKFNPYYLKIVPFKDVNPKNYYTISKSGILHFEKGFADFISTDNFMKEMYIYDVVSSMGFFRNFTTSKCFRIWRSNIAQTKIKKNRKQLEELLFTTKDPLRNMLGILVEMLKRIENSVFLAIDPKQIYSTREFRILQMLQRDLALLKCRELEKKLLEMTIYACRTHLIEMGFTYDTYDDEVAYYKKGLKIPVENLTNEIGTYHNYPGQWLPYSLQSKKKRICRRLSNFIHLVDFYVQAAYHKLLKISVVNFMCELYHRARLIPKELGHAPKYHHKYSSLRRKNEALFGKAHATNSELPVFEISVSYTDFGLVFLPPAQVFLSQIRHIYTNWKEGVASYENMLPNEVFNIYTRPVVNGHMEEKDCGDGPSVENLYNTDPELFEMFDVIDAIILHGFDACREYIDQFDFIRIFCIENDRLDVTSIRLENGAESLRELLEKYHEQLQHLQKIEDGKDIGIFHVNNLTIRRKSLSSVMRAVHVLNDHIPKLFRKSVTKMTNRIDICISKLDKELELLEDYAFYLIALEEIEDQVEEIETGFDYCGHIYELIEDFEIPRFIPDIKSYRMMVPLYGLFHRKLRQGLKNRESYMEKLIEMHQDYRTKFLEDMDLIRSTIDKSTVVDAENDPIAIMQTLEVSIEKLKNYQENTWNYKTFQQSFKELDPLNYEVLDELKKYAETQLEYWNTVWNHLQTEIEENRTKK